MADTATRAILFGGLADPARLALVGALGGDELRVGDLAAATGIAQPSVSKHLSCLWDCGLVERERRGREVRYRVTPKLARLLRAADALLEEHGERVRSCERYGRIAAERAAA